MRIRDTFFLAFKDLSGRKIRSWLTIIGIVIGIAAVVGLVGVADSVESEINNQLGMLEGDKISISPGRMSFGFFSGDSGEMTINPLTSDDLEAIKKIPLLSDATGIVSKQMIVGKGDEKFVLTIRGGDPEKWDNFYTLGFFQGRKLSSSDRNSVIVGYSIAHDFFDEDLRVRSRIEIGGKEFKIVGILEPAGGFMSSEDTSIYMPMETARDLMGYDEKYYSTLLARQKTGEDIDVVSDLIEKALLRSRDVSEPDFSIITPDFVQGIVSNITGLMTLLLGSIAGISLVVGGIGIANTMYMTVLEKTREIGIMKSIGAKDNDILILFLLESGIIGIVGGLIGIFFGYFLGVGFMIFRNNIGGGFASDFQAPQGVQSTMNIAFNLPIDVVVMAIMFSFVIGILSGIIPARKASKMNTISALRYE